MEVYSDLYIQRCIEAGVLTKEPIWKYPLRPANLAMVLKTYAVATNRPYDVSNQKYHLLSHHKLYLTAAGFEWACSVYKSHTLGYLRTAFPFLFSRADERSLDHPEKYVGFRNMRGEIGERPKAGSKSRAVLVRRYGKDNKLVREYIYDTLHEARDAIPHILSVYPPEQFTLYRLKKVKGKEYRERVALILGPSRRGVAVNLPHIKE